MRRLFWIIVLLLSVYGCNVINLDTSQPSESDWPKYVKVYFTKPGTSQDTEEDSLIQQRIIEAINGARESVDVCIYELSYEPLYRAIINAHKRGIRVRMVGDINNVNYSGYRELMRNNVPMVLGNNEKIMHNKIVIIDNELVITGSANFTETGFFKNNENVVFIESKEVADYYRREFENMFYNNTFGLDKVGFTNFHSNTFRLGKTEIKVLFSPYVNEYGPMTVDKVYISYITNAKRSIYFSIFSFTHPDIASNMIYMATNKGIKLYGVFDKSWHTGNEYSVHHWFIDAGLNVKYDGNENTLASTYSGGKNHNKYIIIDPETDEGVVLTGSMNFSKAASTGGNDENVVIIKDKVIPKIYLSNFVYLYSIGKHPTRDLSGDRGNRGDVWINEINWPGSVSDNGSKLYNDKFIELKNRTNRRINISGWYILGTTYKSWRIKMFIFPEGSYIEPNGYIVVFRSTNNAFYYTNAVIDSFLYLHHNQDQNYVYLVLKDKYGNVIDVAGDPYSPPFAGYSSSSFASMKRVGADGTLPSSWVTTTGNNSFVRSGYRTRTFATPGTD